MVPENEIDQSLEIQTKMTPEKYIETRLDDQINWYNNKSTSFKTRYKRLKTVEIIAAALIPFLTALSANFSGSASGSNSYAVIGSVLVGVLGITITIIASILNLGQHQKHWIEYRASCESLIREKFLFETKTDPYHTADAFPTLVQRVESILGKENSEWAQFMLKPPPEKTAESK